MSRGSQRDIRTAFTTSSTSIVSMQTGLPCVHGFRRQGLQSRFFLITICPLPYGPVNSGSVGPNNATTGVPKAAAICIGPESFVMSKLTLASNAASLLIVVLPVAMPIFSYTREVISFAIGTSSLLPTMIIPAFTCLINYFINAEYETAGQRFLTHLADGLMAIRGCLSNKLFSSRNCFTHSASSILM